MRRPPRPGDAGPEPARRRTPLDYTPRHLADKILGSKSALEGERKQVTVLFADVRNVGGRFDQAQRVLGRALDTADEAGVRLLRPGIQGSLADALAGLGRPKEAVLLANEAIETVPEIEAELGASGHLERLERELVSA
jgi:class 3 adenylate cyclase